MVTLRKLQSFSLRAWSLKSAHCADQVYSDSNNVTPLIFVLSSGSGRGPWGALLPLCPEVVLKLNFFCFALVMLRTTTNKNSSSSEFQL